MCIITCSLVWQGWSYRCATSRHMHTEVKPFVTTLEYKLLHKNYSLSQFSGLIFNRTCLGELTTFPDSQFAINRSITFTSDWSNQPFLKDSLSTKTMVEVLHCGLSIVEWCTQMKRLPIISCRMWGVYVWNWDFFLLQNLTPRSEVDGYLPTASVFPHLCCAFISIISSCTIIL